MALNSFEFRKGVFARLDSQLPHPIYSYVPQDSEYPYVRLGDITVETYDTVGEQKQRYDVDIHAFDRSAASTEVIEGIVTDIQAALHRQESNIAVTGYNMVLARHSNTQVFQQGEPNDRYWHAVSRYEFIIETN